MESGRIILAIALSFLVFLVWDMFFTDKEAIQKARQQQLAEQQAAEAVKEEPIPETAALPAGTQDKKKEEQQKAKPDDTPAKSR